MPMGVIFSTAGAGEGGVIIVWLFLWVGIGGGVGALIGSSKGKGGSGFVLGLLLGFIGWIIAAVMSRTPEKEAEYQRQVAGALGASAPAPAAPRGVQQWGPDPYGRHMHRLYDGRRWTTAVSDDGVQANDPTGHSLPTDAAAATEGWAPDPYNRFEQRYHRDASWTEHVSSSGMTDIDPAEYGPPGRATSSPPAN